MLNGTWAEWVDVWVDVAPPQVRPETQGRSLATRLQSAQARKRRGRYTNPPRGAGRSQ
jgi:hypothetical protein